MNSILEKIAKSKRKDLILAKKLNPLSSLERKDPEIRDFVKALDKDPAIIAEIKKASPSKGVIRQDFFVSEIAKIYAESGAACLSVLTDIKFFQGQPSYLELARKTCNLPILRKDFIIDSYQVMESYALGADCILLIAAMLDDNQLMDFCQQAQELGLTVLVEIHSEEELNRALKLPTKLIGINNRNLHTFATDINLSIELAKSISKDKIIISESGINTVEDINYMQAAGISRFLIGESLMRAKDIGAKLKELRDLSSKPF